LLLKRIKKELYLQELPIKDNFLFVIGQPDQLIKLELKMTPLLDFGINREALDQSLPWIYYLQMTILF
jgi:hypothetical protein